MQVTANTMPVETTSVQLAPVATQMNADSVDTQIADDVYVASHPPPEGTQMMMQMMQMMMMMLQMMAQLLGGAKEEGAEDDAGDEVTTMNTTEAGEGVDPKGMMEGLGKMMEGLMSMLISITNPKDDTGECGSDTTA